MTYTYIYDIVIEILKLHNMSKEINFRVQRLIKVIHDVINNGAQRDQKIIDYGIDYDNQKQRFALVKTCKIITTIHENRQQTHEEEDYFFLVDLKREIKKEITEIGYNRNYEVFFFESESMLIAINSYQTVFGYYNPEILEIKTHYESHGTGIRPAKRPVFSSWNKDFVLIQVNVNLMFVYSVKDREKISIIERLEDDGQIEFACDFKVEYQKDFTVCAVIIQHETTAYLRKRIDIFVKRISWLKTELKNSIIAQDKIDYLNIIISEDRKTYSILYGNGKDGIDKATHNISGDLD